MPLSYVEGNKGHSMDNILQRPRCSRLTTCTKATWKEQSLRIVLMIYFMQHLCSKVSFSQEKTCESLTTRTAFAMKSSSSAWV